MPGGNEKRKTKTEKTRKIRIKVFIKKIINNQNISIMRKNFLLLMLMALLPLAGWAEEKFSADKTIVAVSRIEYQQIAEPTIRVTHDGLLLTKNDDYDFDGFYEANDGTGSEIAKNDLQAGNEYYVKVVGKGVYTGAAYGKFSVEKATLTVIIADATDFTQSYMTGSDYALKADKSDVDVTWTGHTITDVTDYLTFGTNYSYSYGTNRNAGSYAIEFTGITAKDATNFDITIEPRTMVIEKQTISTGGLYTTTRTAASYDATAQFTYTATAQKPTYTVEWDHDNNSATAKIALVENKDFVVTYYDNGGNQVAATDLINAGTYGVKISGIGNYDGTADYTGSTPHQFTIKMALLTVMVLPQEKVYDGTAFDLTTAKFNVSGRVGGDAGKTVEGLEATTGSTSSDAGSYSIDVDASAATIGGVLLSNNYDITTVPVNWTIKQRPVTVTVPDVTMVKGDALPTLPGSYEVAVEQGYDDSGVTGETGAINATDKSAIAGCYAVALADDPGEALAGVTASNIEAKDYAEAIKTSGTNTQTNYLVTITNGTLKVQGADFTVMPVVESDIEYGNTYTISYYTAGTIDESKLVFEIDGKEYPYAAQIDNLPTALGNYTVSIKPGTAVGTGDYLNGEATLQTSAYTIQKRKVTLTVNDQTVHKNDPVAILNELTADNGYTVTSGSLVDGENPVLDYDFATTIVQIGGDKITGYVGSYDQTTPGAITAVPTSDAVNANYDFTIEGGKLTISEDFTADLATATAKATITEGANNGSAYTVTISGRKLNANAWNVLVLPFEVSTFDFCKAIDGYAVFNVLNSAKGGNVKFKLELDKIPANQPFLVKPLAAVDFDTTSGTPAVKTIKFNDVKFVDGTPTQSITGAEFIGTYEDITIEDDDYYAMQGGEFKHFSSNATLGFTRAYIKLASGVATARFFVEEPGENGTTAIKELNTKTMQSVATDGWYSVNGVRLQGAPTQKGIYINNGKKIVVK